MEADTLKKADAVGGSAGSGSAGDGHDPSQPSNKKPQVKKRTKTGCLTCRRRRIKCDEGKPRCNNCIKSKRLCDGYNQRVIFKDPLGTYQSGHLGNIMFQGQHPHQMLANHQLPPGARNMQLPQGALPFIAPRPPMPHQSMPLMQHHYHQQTHQPQMHMHGHPQSLPHQNLRQHALPPQGLPPHAELHHGQTTVPNTAAFAPHNPTDNAPLDNPASFNQPWQQLPPDLTGLGPFTHPDMLGAVPLDANFLPAEGLPLNTAIHPAQWHSGDILAGNMPVPVQHQNMQPAQALGEPSDMPNIQPNARPNLQPQVYSYDQTDAAVPTQYHIFEERDAYWFPDDDASMAESDEEEETDDENDHLENNDLGVIVAGRLHGSQLVDAVGTRLRTFSTSMDDYTLSTYVPSSTSSPLNDAQTAAVFWYFVNVTGPSMSLFERRPFDPTPIFQGQPVPRSRQHIWTYTFPIIALNHPALLQAMLALGSLQMAKLQGLPHTASMKHYHLSLRRVARNYQSASRRVQPATLAATMLLGFYEVWNSDHDKWCKHMWGARAILKEIPLRDMTNKILTLKRDRRRILEDLNISLGDPDFSDPMLSEYDIDLVDSTLVTRLSGRPVAYDEATPDPNLSYSTGPIPAWTAPTSYTEKDIETYELISDVFWWYCKMDVYQSILGGTPLLMEYTYWTQCAPRSPIGTIDAIYGTYDHLMLLLGRLCNFQSKDAVRKRKAKKMEGPGAGPPGQSPPFSGMMPSTGHVTIPTGFSPPREASPQSETQEEIDFEASTAAALSEWESIRETLEMFRTLLGQDFEALGPEYEPPISSPFGTALKYRTYSIASIWMNYYMGLIVLHRAHPSMPPVAMAAAGMAARQTAPYANQIGRIICGLEDLTKMDKISTLLGGVSIESSFPLFVAAVQYQDMTQRHWTVRRLQSVARLTGWQSARQIAIGCETGWTKAASMGRGPPYESPADSEEVPSSIWDKPRRISDRIRELDNVDERLVLSSSERPQYAVGLLSMEADLEKLDLRDK